MAKEDSCQHGPMVQGAHLSGEPGAESVPARSPEEVSPSEGASVSPSAPSGRHTTSTAPVQARVFHLSNRLLPVRLRYPRTARELTISSGMHRHRKQYFACTGQCCGFLCLLHPAVRNQQG